jgi:hypothetical protein
VRSIVVTTVDLRLHSFVSIRVCNGGPRAVHGESARREVERTKPPLPKKADVRQLHRHALHGYPSRRRAQTAQHCPLSASSASAKTTACTRACYGRWAQVCDAATRGAADRQLPPSRRAVSPRRRGAGGPLRAPRGAVSEHSHDRSSSTSRNCARMLRLSLESPAPTREALPLRQGEQSAGSRTHSHRSAVSCSRSAPRSGSRRSSGSPTSEGSPAKKRSRSCAPRRVRRPGRRSRRRPPIARSPGKSDGPFPENLA